MNISAERRRFLASETFAVCAVALVVAVVLCLLAANCMARPLSRDEEQFVASGALLSREGLLPYVAYPYFHLPNLVFIFAGLFLTNDHLLLTARTFNFVCAATLLIVVFTLTARAFAFVGQKRWLMAAAATLSLCLNPFFQFTAGRAWNHDLPLLATVLALLAILSTTNRKGPLVAISLSGLLLGLAIGTRLTFLPLVVPFVFLIWMRGSLSGSRLLASTLFAVALVLALLPTIVLFARAHDRFIFDNWTYNGLINLRYRQSTVAAEITPLHKLLFPFRQVAKSPSTLSLIVAFIYFGWRTCRGNSWRAIVNSGQGATFLIFPFLLIGAWMPTPSYRQYYYAVVPFLLIGTLFSLASLAKTGRLVWSSRVLVAIAALGFLELLPDLPRTRSLTSPKQWPVFKVHNQGMAIRRRAGPGPILTLAPIFVLEGGATIYKEFATGPFAWRASPFVQEEKEARYDLVDAEDLAEFLLPHPPSAILTGNENAALERPLIEYARAHGYRAEMLQERNVLWVKSP